MIQTIGILTGGGDAPGLNAVIRAVTKSAVLGPGWRVVGIEEGYEGLMDPVRTRPLRPDNVQGILPKGGTILKTSSRGNPYEWPERDREGNRIYVDRHQEILTNAERLGLDALVCIGGDGTLATAKNLGDEGLRVIGIPKTIDNDLPETDFTFGFNTALTTATEALDKLHTTAESHNRVMVVEMMGRYAGWIALESAIAGGADVALIPEIPFELDVVAEKIRDRRATGSLFSLVVVGEGALPEGGDRVVQESADETGGQERLGGIGEWMAGRLEEMTGMSTRCVVLGHLQRGGSPTAFDRVLATRLGVMAVTALRNGEEKHMVRIRGNDIGTIPLSECVGRIKTVPPRGHITETAEKLGISLGRPFSEE
ncbi:MAG: ATP-dependent 6-phosphofructokinase [bacterium]